MERDEMPPEACAVVWRPDGTRFYLDRAGREITPVVTLDDLTAAAMKKAEETRIVLRPRWRDRIRAWWRAIW